MKTKTLTLMIAVAVVGTMLFSDASYSAEGTSAAAASKKIAYYTCPMHSDVKSEKPGDCPTCGMHLVPVYENAATNSPSASYTNSATVTLPSCCASGCSMN